MNNTRKFNISSLESLIEILRMAEHTVFTVGYKDGAVYIEPVLEQNIESADNELYIEDYQEGVIYGYREGYRCGFYDAMKGNEYYDSSPSACGINCDYDCCQCRFTSQYRCATKPKNRSGRRTT